MMPRIFAALGMIACVFGMGFLIMGPVSSANPAPDPVYVKECSACHIAYPSQFLPKRSWDRILGSLDKHFGENATLPPKSLASIKTYLDGHAADSTDSNSRIMRDVRIFTVVYWPATPLTRQKSKAHPIAPPAIAALQEANLAMTIEAYPKKIPIDRS